MPSRIYTSLIRTCALNLIAQIAIGTPIAAQTLPYAQARTHGQAVYVYHH